MNCTDEKAFDAELLAKLNYDPNRDSKSLAEKTIALVKDLYFGNNFSNCNFNTTTTVSMKVQTIILAYARVRIYEGSDRYRNVDIPVLYRYRGGVWMIRSPNLVWILWNRVSFTLPHDSE